MTKEDVIETIVSRCQVVNVPSSPFDNFDYSIIEKITKMWYIIYTIKRTARDKLNDPSATCLHSKVLKLGWWQNLLFIWPSVSMAF